MKNLKIFAKTIDEIAIKQIDKLMSQEAFKNEKVRIMSDVHAGKGCVIGLTSTIGTRIIPNIVGVDLYCGMLLVKLGNIELNLEKIDDIVKKKIPAGFNVHDNLDVDDELKNLYKEIEKMKCFSKLKYNKSVKNGIGTLGGGNHFIEIDEDSKGNKYLVIHSGSRNLGSQVANIYQQRAIDYCHGGELSKEEKDKVIRQLKLEGREKEIEVYLKNTKSIAVDKNVDEELCYLEDKDKENYLRDIKVCYQYSNLNRRRMATAILEEIFKTVDFSDKQFICDNSVLETFEILHNYIDLDNGIIRKGAVSSKKGERLLIPINMKDGSLICRGLGNEEWNCSAPHGAGRLMSRKQARETIKLEEYKQSMKGIYSSTVDIGTIDEAPQAYKSIEEIKEGIKPTVEIIEQIKPIYNFKAKED